LSVVPVSVLARSVISGMSSVKKAPSGNSRRANPVGGCPLTAALAALGGTRKLIIVHWLAEAPRHFAGLHAVIPGISRKVLTQQLRELMADGIVCRRPTGAVPAPVEYSLTEYGTTALPLVAELRRWGAATSTTADRYVRPRIWKPGDFVGVLADHASMATMHVDRIGPDPFPRVNLVALAGRTLGAIPPPAQVLVGILSVQVGAALAKQLFGTVGSTGTVALRLFFAAVVLLLLWRPKLRMDRTAWLIVLGYGVVLGAMNLCFYLALSRIPLGVAVTIEFLGPLTIALAGSRRWLDALWALLAAGGVVLLTEGRGDLELVGVLFALAAAVCWGTYILLSAALGRHTTEGSGLALAMAIAALVAAPVGVVDSGTALLSPWVLLVGLGVALLSSVVPYSLELEALRRIPPKVFGVLMSLEPAVAALVGLVVLGEVLQPLQWVAVLCVVAASVGATRMIRTES
jgi:inner membrane transporter RhtA